MKPDNIFIVRHGQSAGNVDRNVYKDLPDYALPLTKLGREQAREVGKEIRKLIPSSFDIPHFYVSPFWRTRQTFLGIKKSFPEETTYYEDPRLREQEWGQNMESREGYKETVEVERDNYGHFYYRFRDGGESCADVFDRVSDFLGTMYRDFQKEFFPKSVIIVTHGMTMRLLMMRWFHCTVEEFESWGNPRNCQFFHLRLHSETEKYQFIGKMRVHTLRHPFQFDWGRHSQYGKPRLPTCKR